LITLKEVKSVMFQKKKIIVGVSGGIAVYKACTLVSQLVQEGASVKVIMTKSATKFVSPLTFQALSRNPVHVDVFDELDPEKIAHIYLADWADFFILAPATANTISKLAYGIAEDMLLTTLLATTAPVYIAPAMNVNMYANEAIQTNMKLLEKRGFQFIEPGAGYLACGYIGKGRVEEPKEIIQVIQNHLINRQRLKGIKVLISAGPTREIIDPVRFLSNRSSGKTGFAFAEEAANLGAEVTLVTGPVELEVHHPNIKRIDVTTAEDMYEAMHRYFPSSDIVIKTAAVSDYKPVETYANKVKKQPGNLSIEMERTQDILASLGEQKTTQFLVGFAAETQNVLEYGLDKLKRKNLDAIVINNVKKSNIGFASNNNIVTYINKNEERIEYPLLSKHDIAKKILVQICEQRDGLQ